MALSFAFLLNLSEPHIKTEGMVEVGGGEGRGCLLCCPLIFHANTLRGVVLRLPVPFSLHISGQLLTYPCLQVRLLSKCSTIFFNKDSLLQFEFEERKEERESTYQTAKADTCSNSHQLKFVKYF